MTPIEQRMKDTGWTRQQVEDELAMMKAAQDRLNSGKLTNEDKAEMARCKRDWYEGGCHRMFRA